MRHAVLIMNDVPTLLHQLANRKQWSADTAQQPSLLELHLSNLQHCHAGFGTCDFVALRISEVFLGVGTLNAHVSPGQWQAGCIRTRINHYLYIPASTLLTCCALDCLNKERSRVAGRIVRSAQASIRSGCGRKHTITNGPIFMLTYHRPQHRTAGQTLCILARQSPEQTLCILARQSQRDRCSPALAQGWGG